MRAWGYVAVLALCALASAAAADAPGADAPGTDAPGMAAKAAPETGTLSLLFENDLFYNTDRDYTNGVLIAYTLGPDETPSWLSRGIDMIPYFGRNPSVRQLVELGQNIYTPADLSLTNPPLTMRPYAGFLYLGLGLVTQAGRQQDELHIQLGVIGPDSLAGNAQKFIHSAFNFHKPMGWNTQLGNEPALETSYEHSWRFAAPAQASGFGLDINPHGGIALGNVYDYVNLGALARIGFNLPDDYGPVRIDPSLPGSSFYEGPANGARWTLYAFGGFDGRVIGRNIFLDGNSFAHSRSVAKNVLAGDLQFGVTFAIGWLRISLTHVFRSKEYHTQPGVDQFGAVNVSIRL